MGVTFIGHSSFFLQIGGQNVVIDPNFARWLFVLKRLRQPGLRVRDLPAIDLVLVTHAHFDHLHRPSLRAIVQQTKRRHGVAPTILVPHHVFDLVSDLGFDNVVEMDWWNSYRHRELTVTHVPSRHWGARVIEDSHRGYGGLRAARPAGIRFITPATRPTSPASARSGSGWRRNWRCCPSAPTIRRPSATSTPVRPMPCGLSLILKSRWMVPMHYGTFRLSHEPMDEPLQLLEKETKAAGIEDRVFVLEEGVTRFF